MLPKGTVRDTENITFSTDFHEGIPQVALRQKRAAKQQITDLLCAGVYEVDHYHGSMVYIRVTSPHRVRRSKPFVVLLLLHEH